MQTPFLDKFILGDKTYSEAEIKQNFENIQAEITSLKSKLEELQTKVDNPKEVTIPFQIPSVISTTIENDVTFRVDSNGSATTDGTGSLVISGTDLMLMIQEVAKDVSSLEQRVTKLE